MKRLIKWLRRDTQQQSAAKEAEQPPVGVRVRSETEDNYSDDSSFSWAWTDQADSSIFDTGNLIIEKSENKDAVPQKTLTLEGDLLCDAEESMGIDPYNTGRFDIENK